MHGVAPVYRGRYFETKTSRRKRLRECQSIEPQVKQQTHGSEWAKKRGDQEKELQLTLSDSRMGVEFRFSLSLQFAEKRIGVVRALDRLPRFSGLVLCGLILLAGGIAVWAQDKSSIEYQVKAAFLYNFAKFVEWPRDSFPNEKSPINLCVFRHDPFGNFLDEIIRGKAINGRELRSSRIEELPPLKACQIVFVSDREVRRLSDILMSLHGSSALVVGESEEFAERGGEIQFFLEDRKLRFSVNVDAVRRARLVVSSKLLALARIVHDDIHANHTLDLGKAGSSSVRFQVEDY